MICFRCKIINLITKIYISILQNIGINVNILPKYDEVKMKIIIKCIGGREYVRSFKMVKY